MFKLTRVSSLLVSVLLVGCATAPKPELPYVEYAPTAKRWYTLNTCSANGDMELNTASLGKVYVQAVVNNYTFDDNQMKTELRHLEITKTIPTKAECNDLAMEILAIKRQIDSHNQAVVADQQNTQAILNSTRPTQAYCNKIGTQTFCNSF